MFLRLRDLANYDRWVAAVSTPCYIDPYSLVCYFEWHINDLPPYIKERIMIVPQIYNTMLIDMVVSFINKENDVELKQIYKTSTIENLIANIFHEIHNTERWDAWNKFAEKFIINELKRWCKDNNIAFGM